MTLYSADSGDLMQADMAIENASIKTPERITFRAIICILKFNPAVGSFSTEVVRQDW